MAFHLIAQKLSTLEQTLLSKGQIDLFRGLKWGIVRLCSSKNAGDMARNLKNQVLAKNKFCKK